MSVINRWRSDLIVKDELMFWSLGNLVIDLCSQAGLEPDMFDVGSLEGEVKGLLISNNNSVVSTLGVLAQNHLFDVSNHGGAVHFVPRGGEVYKHITDDDLVNKKDDVKLNRKDSISIPLTMHLEYFDLDGGLNPDIQTSERSIDSRSREESKTETTEILTSDEAARSISISHKVSVEEQRGEVEVELSRKHIDVVVGDILDYNGDRFRVTESVIKSNSQEYTLAFDRKSNYQSTIKGIPAQKPTPPPDKVIGKSIVEFMDIPILGDQDDSLGFYTVAERTTDAWNGVNVEVSIDGGQNFIYELGVGGEGCVGYLTEELPIHTEYYQDTLNTIKVKLADRRDTLESFNHRDVMNRLGMILVGDEIMNYEVADDVDEDGNWELSLLLRGRKGTKVKTHPVGTRVVFLDIGEVNMEETALTEVDREYTFKITSYNTVESYEKVFNYKGNSQRERAPTRVRYTRDGDDMIISWSGVGMLGGGYRVAHSANFVGYRVTVDNEVHEVTKPTLRVPYKSGSVITVQQVNRFMGAGDGATITT